MLDQLVESKSNARENSKRSGFMLTTTIIALSLLLGGWVYSLFAQDYGMGGDDLELSTLVAPVQLPDNEPPPPPAPEDKPDKNVTEKTDTNVDIRKEIIQNINESPSEVTKINTDRADFLARRQNVLTREGGSNQNAANPTEGTVRRNDTPTEIVRSTPTPKPVEKDDEDPPPPPKPTPKPEPKTISGGVVNGKATSLPKPSYPAAARAVGAKGSVSVQVLIDENGNVVSANAINGHPLLQGPAAAAARRARFAPTKLSGQPVKVSGVITYVFN